MIPHHWKRAAADNGSADPNLDVRPGRSASTVLGAIRGLMASGAASRDDAIGELVATLGGSTTNVYSVASNEGLIDITTGINGIPAAITAPFLLRLGFDTVLKGSATNVPHLKVDGFDCGPILNNGGGAVADGDLTARPVLVFGDMAATTDTKVTRVRVLDLLPSDLSASVPLFHGRLICTGPAELRLMPDESSKFFVNGKLVTIPTAGIPISNANLSGTADLYAYLDGSATLSFDGPPVVSPTYGNLVDPTTGLKSLTGYSRLGFATAGQFSAAGTLSRYCKRDRVTMGPVFGASLSTQYAWLAGSNTPFVCWPDEAVDISWDGWEAQATQGTGLYNYSRLGVDSTVLTNQHTSGGAAYQNSGDGSRWGGPLAVGQHTAMVQAYSNVAGSVTTGQVLVKTRG